MSPNTTSTTPQKGVVGSPNGTIDSSPGNGNDHGGEQKDADEAWSGDEGEEVVEADGSRKRKRPMSVSCEMCKSRKACVAPSLPTGIDGIVPDPCISNAVH
ncbi:uncharacterized protein RHO25_009088 [Cercospora beticola]|uniref:Zn(2)-C6 fungal-type domain-containing protein n=1 Tax=Cercospora beticola TaxID=122368 RepID=A0ABZ0NYA0_CERBT|nr:hypothetical protein RHO25_009088 [Cercospora beticola]